MSEGPVTHTSLIGHGIIAALLSSLIALSASAHGNVLTEPLHWQASSIESGLARLKAQYLDISVNEDVEFVGAVLRTADGTYRFTQGRGKRGQDTVTFRIRPPADAEVVGFWHTHGGGGPAGDLFSRTDAGLVREQGLPFYLITPDGQLRVLRPDHVRAALALRARGSAGRLPRGAHPGERLGREAAGQDAV